MTQANNRHGADWTKALGDGDGPPRGGGTESNRARAARGGHGPDVLSVYLDGQRIAAAPMNRVEVGVDHANSPDFTATQRIVIAPDGQRYAVDVPRFAAGPTCDQTIRFHWCGEDYAIHVLASDTAADMAAKVAAATGAKVSGGTVELPVPCRPTSAAWSGMVRGPVVSLPSTLAEAERLYGKGSPVWEAVRARVLAGVAATDPAPQPDPAPGQVWLPPPGACPVGWMPADGLLAIAAVDGGTVRFGGDAHGCCIGVEALTDGAGGWTCVGVATPHGRVMVGDGFAFSDGRVCAIVDISNDVDGVILSSGVSGARASVVAATWTRTRYAPARVGERYASRLTPGRVAEIDTRIDDGTLCAFLRDGSARHGLIEALPADGRLDPARWERLDPGPQVYAALKVSVNGRELRDATDDVDLDGARRPGESIDAYKARMVLHIKRDQDRLLASASPMTATGAALDRLASGLFGVERRLGTGTAYRGSTERESDESLRARCEAKLGLPHPHTGAGEPWTSSRSTPLDDLRTAALDAIASGMGIERREAVKPTGPRTITLAEGHTLTPLGDGRTFRIEPATTPPILHIAAPHADLRALFDAIGRALESATPHCVAFDGHPLTVQRDEMLFTPTWSEGRGASLRADARALCALRAAVGEAMATGAASLAQWGAKGPRVEVRREGGAPVVAAVAPEASEAPRYTPDVGGGVDQWRWEV